MGLTSRPRPIGLTVCSAGVADGARAGHSAFPVRVPEPWLARIRHGDPMSMGTPKPRSFDFPPACRSVFRAPCRRRNIVGAWLAVFQYMLCKAVPG